MNSSPLILEIAVLILGLAVLLLDLWTAPERKRLLGYGASAALAVLLAYSFRMDVAATQYAFGWDAVAGAPDAHSGPYVLDGLALYFKRFFLLAAILVLIIAVEFADRIPAGISEFYSLVIFALAGMMFAASANDFT